MKKFFQILLLLFITSTVSYSQFSDSTAKEKSKPSQENFKNEVYGGYGAFSVFHYTGRKMGANRYYETPQSWGSIHVGFSRKLNKVISLGCAIGYEDFHYNGTETVVYKGNDTTWTTTAEDQLIVGIATINFCYLNKPLIRIYSGLGLGITIDAYKVINPVHKAMDALPGPAGQITLLGISVGRTLGGFVELGYGSFGMVSAGLSYNFKDFGISRFATALKDTTKIYKASNQRLYRSGTILVSTENPGKLYFDDKYIGKIVKFNLIKIRGVRPGIHSISVKTASDSAQTKIDVRREWKYTCMADGDTILVKRRLATDPLLANRVHTKRFSYVPKIRGFYNVSQIGLISIGMNSDGYYPLNSISTICGYRFTPRFSMGLGAGFTLMQSDRISVDYSRDNGWNSFPATSHNKGKAGFFPIFLDFRSDWALKKVSPMFYLNIGFILVYHQTLTQFEYIGGYQTPPTVVVVELPASTGPYFISTGFGTKIYVFKGLAIIPAIEFSYKQVRDDVYQGKSHFKSSHGFIKFLTLGLVLGITF